MLDTLPNQGMQITGLSYGAGRQALLNGIDLALPVGGTTMLLGPNGAGKSLLLKLMHGLLMPTRGTISWNGQPLTPVMRARQAMVFQKPVLLRRSVAANVDFAIRARGRADIPRRDAMLDLVGLGHLGSRAARKLSGGEQQRLALARALATSPELLFLDEPTASLDPASALMIETCIRDVCRQGTRIIFVTHDVSQARRLADDVVFLHHGQVHEHSSAERFFNRPESDAARQYLEGRIIV